MLYALVALVSVEVHGRELLIVALVTLSQAGGLTVLSLEESAVLKRFGALYGSVGAVLDRDGAIVLSNAGAVLNQLGLAVTGSLTELSIIRIDDVGRHAVIYAIIRTVFVLGVVTAALFRGTTTGLAVDVYWVSIASSNTFLLFIIIEFTR